MNESPVLTEAMDPGEHGNEWQRLAHGFAMQYGLRRKLTYRDAIRLEADLAAYLIHHAASQVGSLRGALQTVAQWDPWAARWLEQNP